MDLILSLTYIWWFTHTRQHTKVWRKKQIKTEVKSVKQHKSKYIYIYVYSSFSFGYTSKNKGEFLLYFALKKTKYHFIRSSGILCRYLSFVSWNAKSFFSWRIFGFISHIRFYLRFWFIYLSNLTTAFRKES